MINITISLYSFREAGTKRKCSLCFRMTFQAFLSIHAMSVLVHYQFTQSHLFNVRAACWVNHQVHTERFYFLWLSKHPCKCNMWFWRSCFYFHSFYLALFELKKVPSSPFGYYKYFRNFTLERFGTQKDLIQKDLVFHLIIFARHTIIEKQSLRSVFSKWCSQKFHKIHKKHL